MRIRDWSSDVCSSDLLPRRGRRGGRDLGRGGRRRIAARHRHFLRQRRRAKRGGDRREAGPSLHLVFPPAARFIARAYSPVTPIAFMPTTSSALTFRYPADRKSVVSGKSVSVRVDIGGRRIIKQKKTNKLQTDT